MVCLLESASRAEKAAEAVQQFVRRGFDVMDGPVEFAICIDLFLSQEGLKLEGKGVEGKAALQNCLLKCAWIVWM